MTVLPEKDQDLDGRRLPWTGMTVGEARGVLAAWQAPRPSRRNYEAEMLTLGRGFLTLLETGPEAFRTDEHGLLLMPVDASGLDMTLDRARLLLSGWHFAKESLSAREQELLYVVEGLLRLLDDQAPNGDLR